MPQLDKKTADRMGYEGAVAAETLILDGMMIEVCLIGPSDIYGPGFHLAVHVDCDPDRPTQGTSEFDSCGLDIAAALAVYDAKVEELKNPADRPSLI